MAVAVITVATGGLAVIDVTSTAPNVGLPVAEALNGRGIAVTKVSANGLPVTYAEGDGGGESSSSSIMQTGPILTFPFSSSATSGTVSSTITVPADAQFLVVGISGYVNSATGHYGSATFTKGGADTGMPGVVGADSNSYWQTAMYYMVSPDTGTNKVLKYNWNNTQTEPNVVFSLTFWKGIDLSSPRSSGGAQGNSWPRNTPTLTCVAGDKIVAFSGFVYVPANGAGGVTAWNNLTELAEVTHQSMAEGAWATGNPSGNTTVGVQSCDGVEGGLCALVLKAIPDVSTMWPDASNTGVPAGTTLTTFSGHLSSSANGQIIEAMDVSGTIIVNHTNVTIKNCKASNIKLGDTGAAHNFIIYDSTVAGYAGNGIWVVNGHDGQILRCNLSGFENFIALSDADRCVIQDNWMHDALPYNPVDDPHTDGVQIFPGNVDISIRHNYINFPAAGINSCVTTSNVTNVVIDNCKMRGGTYNVYWEGTTTGCVVRDCVLDATYSISGGYIAGSAAASQTYTNNTNWAGTPLSLP